MNSMLATEATVATEGKRLTLRPLETWAENEPMRHIPPLEWIIRKTDVELRERIHKLTAVFATLPSSDPRWSAIDAGLRLLGGAIDRLADTANPSRHNGNGSDLPARLDAALTQAVASLRTLESMPFGRRYPFHTGDRSKAEPVYSALLAVMCHVERIVPLIRDFDPDFDGERASRPQ